MSKTEGQLKIEQTINELYEKYPKEMVNKFLNRIVEMNAEDFAATVKLCKTIDRAEVEKQKETTR